LKGQLKKLNGVIENYRRMLSEMLDVRRGSSQFGLVEKPDYPHTNKSLNLMSTPRKL
jgi:hypothetical protein